MALALAMGGAVAAWSQAPLPPGTRAEDSNTQPAENGPLSQAEAAIDSKNYGKARAMLDGYLSAHSSDARALFDRGYCDDAEGHLDAAEGYYRKAIAADPKQFEARLALGLLLAQSGSADARTELETAITLEPNPPNPGAKAQAYRTLARLLRQSDPDKAKEDLIDALKLSPESADDTLLTAEIAEAEGDKSIAEEAYRRALKIQPDSSAAISGLAHLLMQEKKYSEAEPLLKSALSRDPDDPALNAQFAALLGAEGKTDEAVGALEKLYRLKPKDREIGMMLADAYVQSEDYEKADAVYANLLASAPDSADVASARGQVLIREQKYQEALEMFQRAVKSRQDDSDAWGGIAFAASKTGQYQLTVDALTMRSKLVSDTPVTYFLWATAYDNLHQYKQSVEYYQLFLKSALGKFPDEEWQAKQRLTILEKNK
ncbi:MAG: tetratricopeptide repeat protein [Acidobacteriaceae bacterium]|nr:tetratricopeptide repeat protein [Acidobacteriaceae bacterium]